MTDIPRPGRWAFIVEHSLLLVAGTIAALVWANVDQPSYETFANSVHFAVNDIGMVFFFAVATGEIIASTAPGGALASFREAGVPLLAAAGGMIGPAGLYRMQVALLGQPSLFAGWAIPCVTDIAFSSMAARLIFPRGHPAIPFLLLLAIADDALGLILLAAFYPSGSISLGNLVGLMVPALALAFLLNRRGVKTFWAYVIGAGGLSWAALFLGGLHPALALVPVLPFMPHARRETAPSHPGRIGSTDTLHEFERWWKVPVQVILFFFGLANAGVALSSVGPVTWIVLSSLLVGKPLGILLLTFTAIQFGLRAPGGLRYRHMLVVGLTAGVGFTVALFFATAAFPAGRVLEQAKMGALLSFAAAPLAIGLGRAIGIRRSS